MVAYILIGVLFLLVIAQSVYTFVTLRGLNNDVLNLYIMIADIHKKPLVKRQINGMRRLNLYSETPE